MADADFLMWGDHITCNNKKNVRWKVTKMFIVKYISSLQMTKKIKVDYASIPFLEKKKWVVYIFPWQIELQEFWLGLVTRGGYSSKIKQKL